jgi:hypothetical protein
MFGGHPKRVLRTEKRTRNTHLRRGLRVVFSTCKQNRTTWFCNIEHITYNYSIDTTQSFWPTALRPFCPTLSPNARALS